MENRAKVGENNGADRTAAETAADPNQLTAKDGESMAPTKRTTSPAFQFYPKDFLTSPRVMAMTPTERGIYITLLCFCWLEGGLKDDVKALAKLAGVPLKQFARIWPHNLEPCFRLVRNGWRINERLEAERKKQIAFRERQAENGARGGRPKKNPPKSDGFHAQNPPLTQAKARALKSEEEDRRSVSLEGVQGEPFDGQAAFMAFQAAYPSSRRKGGRMVMETYLHSARIAGAPAALLLALENHKASQQWANPAHIPGMDVWLSEERWRQELPPAGAMTSSMANPRTAGNIPALQRFIDRGKAAVNE